MFYIDSKVNKPNINKLKDRISSLMEGGIAVQNLDDFYRILRESKAELLKIINNTYKIENPNSYNQVLAYFQKEINKEIIEFISKTNTRLNISDIKGVLCSCYLNNIKDITDFADSIADNLDINIMELREITDDINELLKTSMIQYLYKNGKWVTNKEAMIQLSLLGREDAKHLIQYRRVKNYIETIERFKTSADGNGYVHPVVSLAKTNRINYSEPALLNISKDILWNIIAPRKEGNVLYSIDIKNQEPSIMINMLGIEELKDILLLSDKLYENIYYLIFNEYPNELQRKELKVSWLSLTYGASSKSIQESCNYIDGKEVYKFFNSFKPYKDYKSKCQALAKKNVQTITTYFGTEVHANEFGSKLKRVLMDLPIQGTGADILALLVEHFDDEIEFRSLQDYIYLYYTRHDELIVEIDRSYFDAVGEAEIVELLKDIFEHQIDDWVPFRVEVRRLNDTFELIGDTYDE